MPYLDMKKDSKKRKGIDVFNKKYFMNGNRFIHRWMNTMSRGDNIRDERFDKRDFVRTVLHWSSLGL